MSGEDRDPGAGREDLHLTVRGKMVDAGVLAPDAGATGQFEIADERSAAEVATMLRAGGLEAVWKDWDAGIIGAAT